MPKEFDKNITDKFRNTFENYNESFKEEAWEQMKILLRKKKKKTIPLWIINTGKVASVILILSLGFLFSDKLTRKLNSEKKYSQNQIINSTENLTDKKINQPNNTLKSQKNTTIIQKKIPADISLNKTRINDKKQKSTTNPVVKNRNNRLAENKIVQHDTLISRINEMPGQKNEIPDTSKNSTKNPEENKKPILLPETDFPKNKTKKKLHFGIAVSSFYTGSDIEASDMINFGGGISADYALTEHLAVNSGLLIAGHQLNTENTRLFGEQLKSDAVNETAYLNSPEKEIKLVSLDIPVNLKYNFKKFELSAGISSLLYFKEESTVSYYKPNNNNAFLYDNINKTDITKPFQTFDFAKLINISANYRIKLKKGSLLLGPYAKIPTGTLTAYDIKFGYGGFNLSYEF